MLFLAFYRAIFALRISYVFCKRLFNSWSLLIAKFFFYSLARDATNAIEFSDFRRRFCLPVDDDDAERYLRNISALSRARIYACKLHKQSRQQRARRERQREREREREEQGRAGTSFDESKNIEKLLLARDRDRQR